MGKRRRPRRQAGDSYRPAAPKRQRYFQDDDSKDQVPPALSGSSHQTGEVLQSRFWRMSDYISPENRFRTPFRHDEQLQQAYNSYASPKQEYVANETNQPGFQSTSWDASVPTAPRAMRLWRSRSEAHQSPYAQSSDSSGLTTYRPNRKQTTEDIPLDFDSMQKAFHTVAYSDIQHDSSSDFQSNTNIVFNTRFRRAEKDIHTIWRELTDLSQGISEDIHRELGRSKEPYIINKPIIGFSGDSGQGKSRLIGALLDDPGLVISADSGRSATRTPIEYRKLHQAATGINYESEIILMPWEYFEYRLKRTLLDLVRGLFHAESIEESTENVHASCQLAKEFLGSFFKNDKRFCDEKSLRVLLKDAKGLEDHAGRAYIFRLARLQYETVKDNPDIFRLKQQYGTTSTQNGMWEKIFPYAFGGSKSALPFKPWPMVRRIIIRSRAGILEHVLIRDLPGLDDHSYLNVEATQKDLMDCDVEVIVHKIGRVISGTSVSMHMRESRERGGRSRKIILVPTMKDHIGAGHGLHLHTAFDATEQLEWDNNIGHKKELERNKPKMDSRFYEYVQEWLKFRDLTLSVKERDRRVIQAWEESEVFPTSAEHYERNVAGYPAKGPIPLLPEDTGIPRLKRYLAEFPSEDRYKKLYNYTEGTLGSLITSLNTRLQEENPETQPVSLHFSSQVSHPAYRRGCAFPS